MEMSTEIGEMTLLLEKGNPNF